MNFRIVLLIVLFLSSFSIYGCGRKDTPVKPSDIVVKN